MATLNQAVLPAPARPPEPDSDLAVEVAEAYRLIAQCWSHGTAVPDSLLNQVDRLLVRVELARLMREKIA